METWQVCWSTTITTVVHSSARPDSVDRLLDNPGVHVGLVVGGSKGDQKRLGNSGSSLGC